MSGHFRTLARYNAWANGRLLEACGALSRSEYAMPRRAFFGSIHGTLNHILLADRLWLGRLEGAEVAFDGLDQILCDGFAALLKARAAEDRRIIVFADRLSPDRLDEVVAYRSFAGETQKTPVRWVLTHMFNHATHHRGQIHDMLTQVPAEPPPLDLIDFLRQTG